MYSFAKNKWQWVAIAVLVAGVAIGITSHNSEKFQGSLYRDFDFHLDADTDSTTGLNESSGFAPAYNYNKEKDLESKESLTEEGRQSLFEWFRKQ